MFFPLSVKDVVRDPFDPAGRIDRELSDRSRRLALGTCLSDDLQSIVSALVVATGKGKYLRILSAATTVHELPQFTAELLQQIVQLDQSPPLEDLLSLQGDVGTVQAAAIEELKCSAGKYVDRLLFVAVTQPDCILNQQVQKFGNEIELTSPQVLAEQTGLSIISSFAKRDIMAGGNGLNLDALPAWILFGNRSHRIASTNRVLFNIGRQARAFYLPASDGIDSDLPEIRFASAPGLRRFDVLLKDGELNLNDLKQLNLDGTESLLANEKALTEKLESCSITKADYARSSVVGIVQEVSSKIKAELPRGTKVEEIVVETPPEIMGTFANQFRRIWPEASVFDGFGWDNCNTHLQPIMAATLGVLSIDQLPANIPWITGAHSQKVLGTLTPGSPANWRQLLRDMADFQPPVMRLRDAV